jgi:hypothetical protein
MRKSLVNEVAIFADGIPIEVAENSGRGQSVKAIIVKVYLHYSHTV